MEKEEQVKRLLRRTNGLLEAMRFSVESAPDNIWKYTSYKVFWRQYQDLAKGAMKVLAAGTKISKIDLNEAPRSTNPTAAQQKAGFDAVYAHAIMLKALLESELNLADDETLKLVDFLQSRLRTVIFSAPDKEVHVQNSVEALLVGRGMQKGINYDRETGRVKFAGKEFIPDFIFPTLQLCLEIKLVKSIERSREVVEEINADIHAYASKYERQVYLVYDVGVIRDADELRRGFEKLTGVEVIVVKH